VSLPPVTVVVPAYNAAATIEECVASLLALDYDGPLELVVVDNGSTDATRALVAGLGATVLEETRRGPAAARNTGLRHATTELVAFTDADCTVEPEWLARLVAPLADATVGIAGGRILARLGANEAERFGELIHDHQAAIEVWRPPYVITMSWASRRAVLEEAGGFDETLRRGEDVDLSWRIAATGRRLVYVPDASVRHRNERTLAGLAREGLLHGLAAGPVLRRHAALVEAARGEPSHDLPPRPQFPARYSRAFEAGKRAGRALDVLRRVRALPGEDPEPGHAER
jgi:glycosyltransferase involved in cell wall biosynthesis